MKQRMKQRKLPDAAAEIIKRSANKQHDKRKATGTSEYKRAKRQSKTGTESETEAAAERSTNGSITQPRDKRRARERSRTPWYNAYEKI